MEAKLTTIAAMRNQEETGYKTEDYLYQHDAQRMTANGPLTGPAVVVDTSARNRMAAWCYQIVDFCEFDRETGAISMSFLDRYLSTSAGRSMALADLETFQLAALTCFYTAVKIHEPQAIDPKLASSLSRGFYSPDQVVDMEADILSALQWRVNPPTALSFVRELLGLIPEKFLDAPMRESVYQLTKFQTELAVGDYNFVMIKASTIAFCAILLSLESLGMDKTTLEYFSTSLSVAANLDYAGMEQVQDYLCKLVVENQQATGMMAIPFPVSYNSRLQTRCSKTVSLDTSPHAAAIIP